MRNSRCWAAGSVRRVTNRAVGVDTGGTFTDVVGADGRSTKVLSDRGDPARAVAAGLAGLGGERPDLLAHGTTVATNALLERRGAPVALVTNAGLADVIEIAEPDCTVWIPSGWTATQGPANTLILRRSAQP